jgi:SAM-dependent methyltransferase
MERLAGARELLDGPLTNREVLRGNLRDLRRLNRLSGGTALSRRALDTLVQVAWHADLGPAGAPRPVRLIDVGTGAGDIPVALLGAWRGRARPLEVVAVDSRPEVIDAALLERPGLAALDGLTLRVADGRALPFEDDSFDVAHASLVLHHLEPDEAAAFLGEMRRVARVGVIVNDLARGRFRWLMAWLALHAATRNPLTRHDGPLSVRRAYTPGEAEDLLGRAGLRVVHIEHGVLRHRWALAAVPR